MAKKRRSKRDNTYISQRKKLFRSDPFKTDIFKFPDEIRHLKRGLSDNKKINDYIGADKRYWSPPLHNHLKTISGSAAEITLSKTTIKQPDDLNQKLSFVNPGKVKICQRRRERRIQLFKTGGIGKGKRIRKPHRWTDDSNIKC